ncbi:hypothetical protein PHYBOEH_007491 [Phytophthora boehmeriae]|uniref:DNA replication checkpoint mediator MRC1 domain-containing protein n=1 Tax=Phytophthora boehmeriae TaxID=109152 RepID=A0A8T1X334_9STRA|nr:hypothetical protein PHYBOEH_007491 [Phytophthora boehmeriae]
MSGEELALETQLLLQQVTQITQNEAVGSVLEDANAPPPVSEFEAAKLALLEKLKKKKEANRAQRHELNQQRYGLAPRKKNDLFSPRKNTLQMLKLPVASTASGGSRKKQNMLTKLKTQAIQQGAQNMAKVFGYSTHEEHLKHLNQFDKEKILQDEMKEKLEKEQAAGQQEAEEEDVEMQGEEEEQAEMLEQERAEAAGVGSQENREPESEKSQEQVSTANDQVSAEVVSPVKKTAESVDEKDEHGEQDDVVVVKRRNRIRKQDVTEEDGNEADSEQDDKEDDDDDADAHVAMETAADVAVDTNEQDVAMEEGNDSSKLEKSSTPKDRAAGYRNLLRAEAQQNRRRKRLVRGDNFVESEAEEDEEEDVLKIGGLGDFGFGVPQAKTQESKEAEEERNALKLREDDLDHIVDDISDDERAQEQDLDEMFRREQEDQDREQVREVMRNVKEGFGRNRRAFSGLHSGSEARGRFNLDELVAADGSKFEAARLGLLESDEELSDREDGRGKKKKINADGEEEEEEEEELDEEAEMERMLRERFMNQPKIYVTSSESGSDDEDENDAAKEKDGADNDEIESDEERERQQMKLFSERARVNRRMQRMKDLQRQIALENNEADPNAKTKAIPNVLLEEDEDSQELMHLLNRTDVDAAPTNTANGSSQTKARTDRTRPKLGRFNSYGGITSSSRGSSSFSRVIGQCKMFSANANSTGSGSSKGFVFTSFSTDKPEQDGDENATSNNDDSVPATRPDFAKSKSWSGAGSKASAKRRGVPGGRPAASSKKHKSGGLFSVLSSYQCVSSTSQNQSQE